MLSSCEAVLSSCEADFIIRQHRLHRWAGFTRCSIVNGKYVDHPKQDLWLRIYEDSMPNDHGTKIVGILTDVINSIKDRHRIERQMGKNENNLDWTAHDNQPFEVRWT